MLAALVALPAAARQASLGELVDHSALRVCADPNNLPFSNDRGEGFENEIAELLAERLGVPVRYTWHPETMGFVTQYAAFLSVRRRDGRGRAPTSCSRTPTPTTARPMCWRYRAADGERFADLDSPVMQEARIGVIAGTPPANLLAERGLLGPDALLPPHGRYAGSTGPAAT